MHLGAGISGVRDIANPLTRLRRGKQVEPTKAAGTSEYQAQTYVFCSAACKRKFESNPAQYTTK